MTSMLLEARVDRIVRVPHWSAHGSPFSTVESASEMAGLISGATLVNLPDANSQVFAGADALADEVEGVPRPGAKPEQMNRPLLICIDRLGGLIAMIPGLRWSADRTRRAQP